MGADRRFTFELQSTSAASESPAFEVVELQGTEGISQLFRFELVLMSTWLPSNSADLQKVLDQRATLRLFTPSGYPNQRVQVPGQAGAQQTELEGLPYHGRLAEFEYMHTGVPNDKSKPQQNFYRAVLVPRLWELSMHRRSRLFVDATQTLRTIVEQLLKEVLPGDFDMAGVASDEASKKYYVAHPYVCQYQESTLDFMSRWLERLGIYYYFEHENASAPRAEKLILLDSFTGERITQAPLIDPRSPMATAMGDLQVHFEPYGPTSTGIHPRAVQSFSRNLRPSAQSGFTLGSSQRNFIDTEAGKAPQVGQWPTDVSKERDLAEQSYGEGFLTQDEGTHYAKVQTQSLTSATETFVGQSTVVGLRSGKRLKFTNHFLEDLNATYLVTEISHEGRQYDIVPGFERSPYGEGGTLYRNRFSATAVQRKGNGKLENAQYRAPYRTLWPRIAGTISAVIQDDSDEGKKGSQGKRPSVTDATRQYAQLDKHGRYWVRLPFDLAFDEKNPTKGSAPIRMATPYGGSDHGMHFPLLRGAEVLLAFMGGDPDQPVIVGVVPNSANPSVVNNQNPDKNRLVTAGGNAIVLDDRKGSEAIWLQSPGNKTTIGLGAIADDVDDKSAPALNGPAPNSPPPNNDNTTKGTGLVFISKGGKKEYVQKDKEEIWTATKYSHGMGSSASISAGFGVDLKLGASVGISASVGADIKLFSDTASFKLTSKGISGDFDTKDFESRSLSAGVDLASSISFKARQRVFFAAITAYTVANLSYQLALKQKWIDWSNKPSKLAMQPASNAAFVGMLIIWKETIDKTLKALKPVSKLDLDQQGVRAFVGTNGESDGSFLELTKTALTLKTKWTLPDPKAVSAPAPAPPPAELKLTDAGDVTVTANNNVTLTSSQTATISGSAAQAQIGAEVTLSAGGTTLTTASGTITANAQKVVIGFGAAPANPAKAAMLAQRATADAARQVAQTAYNQAVRSHRDAQDVMDAFPFSAGTFLEDAVDAAQGVIDSTLIALNSATALYNDLDAKYQAEPANLSAPQPVNGLVIDSAANAKLYAGAATVDLSGTALELKYGAAQMKISATGLEADGVLIKLG